MSFQGRKRELAAMVSNNFLIFSAFEVRNSLVVVMYSSLDSTSTPFAKFCNIFDTNINPLLASAEGGSGKKTKSGKFQSQIEANMNITLKQPIRFRSNDCWTKKPKK